MKRIIAMACAAVLVAGSAVAQICMPAGEMEAALIDTYGESPVTGGTDDAATTLWTSDTRGTWTLVRYLVDGTACTLASGYGSPEQGTDGIPMAAIQQ